jgi:DNA-binding IclR family transcriptional regulator
MSRHPKSADVAENGGSTPLRRAFAVLELIADQPGQLTASEIADALDLPATSMFRLLQRLADLDLVGGLKRNGRFTPGARLMRIAAQLSSHQSLEEIVAPVIQPIADRFGVASYIAGIFGLEVSLLHVCIPKSADVPFVHPGRQFQTHASAAGKLLLALQSDETIEAFLKRRLERLTANTVVSPTALRKQLLDIRRRGYAEATGESDPALWGIAVPVRGSREAVSHGIGVIGFNSSRVGPKEELREQIREALQQAASLLHGMLKHNY